jgi:hypothetical protein
MTRNAMPGKRQPTLEPLDEALGARHPIARSAEPGEEWSWCYLDNVAFVVTRP